MIAAGGAVTLLLASAGCGTGGPPRAPDNAARPVVAVPASAPASASGDGCPVGAGTLWDGLRGTEHTGEYDTGVTGVDCRGGWATALTVVDGPADAGAVLFRYYAATGAWATIDSGSSRECAQVPRAVVTALKRCFPS